VVTHAWQRPAPLSEPVTAVTPVLFIGGLGRSGSTLLELLLGQSDDVCALGEVVHLWERGLGNDERCGCGERFSRCRFWQRVGELAFGGWPAMDRDEVLSWKAAVDRTRFIPRLARARLSERQLASVRRYARLYARIYAAARQATGARVVIDSSKHASLAFALRWASDVDLRVVHLVRDSLAVAHSWGKQVRRPEVVDAEEYMPTFPPLRVSALWTAQNLAFELLGRHAAVTRLRYEDFVADPAGTVRQVRALAGLPDRPDALRVLAEPAIAPRPIHSIAGNPLRFDGRPLRVRPDRSWRTDMPAGTRRMVGATTLPLRLRYGYAGRRASDGPTSRETR
jgi:hypothetical protein